MAKEVLLVVTISLGACFWIPVVVGCSDTHSLHHVDAGHRRLGGGSSGDLRAETPCIDAKLCLCHQVKACGSCDSFYFVHSGPPDLRGGICPDDQYSTIAYLLLEPKEVAIKAR
eukprot:5557690-Amphidinium_carterae.1